MFIFPLIPLQRETNNFLRCEKRKYVRCKIDGARMKYRSHRTRKLYQHVKNLKGDYKNVLYDDCI